MTSVPTTESALHLALSTAPDRPLRIVCLGAHADDIEIGCGGTLLILLQGSRPVTCSWVVFSANEIREREALASARLYLKDESQHTVRVKHFRDGYFPFQGAAIKDAFEALKQEGDPDLVFTHYRDDRHQDHRLISDLTWNTFRRSWILEYEIPKYDGDLGTPNVFVPLSDAVRQQKIAHLMEAFGTQRDKEWFTNETFASLLRLRGVECAATEGYAEAFHGRKITLAL